MLQPIIQRNEIGVFNHLLTYKVIFQKINIAPTAPESSKAHYYIKAAQHNIPPTLKMITVIPDHVKKSQKYLFSQYPDK